MNVLVDTSIWSLAWRKATLKNHIAVFNLTDLIKDNRVRMIGPIRQELLSGIKSESQFEKLKLYLSAFPDLLLEARDYEKAAEFFNTCRQRGIQGSNTDFLICAAAYYRNLEIFTDDNDFLNYQRYVQIKLYTPRTGELKDH